MAQKLGELIDKISIHALREEGDRKPKSCQRAAEEFLSTPSARRATSVTYTHLTLPTKRIV